MKITEENVYIPEPALLLLAPKPPPPPPNVDCWLLLLLEPKPPKPPPNDMLGVCESRTRGNVQAQTSQCAGEDGCGCAVDGGKSSWVAMV